MPFVDESDVEVKATNGTNWRHGDLKPENILRSTVPGTIVGTLRVSDVGLARRHVLVTTNRRFPSSTEFGTTAYEPPEAVIMKNAPRSRLYDIWSFGCIALEFVVWLVYGQTGWDKFWEEFLEPSSRLAVGTRFWSPITGYPGFELDQKAAHYIDTMRKEIPCCRRPSALHALLTLVREKLLVPIDDRIRAESLRKALVEIEAKCQSLGSEYQCPDSHGRRPVVPNVPRSSFGGLKPPPQTYGNGPAGLLNPAQTQRVRTPLLAKRPDQAS